MSFSSSQLLSISNSHVLGFWTDPEEDSSGDEDEEEVKKQEIENAYQRLIKKGPPRGSICGEMF